LRQGLEPLETHDKLVETYIAKKKKEEEDEEEQKSPFTSEVRLRGMQRHNLEEMVMNLEKQNHTDMVDIKRFEASQRAQVQRLHELERRGRELEKTIFGFQQETDELQTLVDRLTGKTDANGKP